MLLAAGEVVVLQGPVTRWHPEGTRPGVLTLTNQRLVFEAQFPGDSGGGATVRTTIDAPLARIRNAGLVPAAGGAPQLEVELPKQRGIFRTPEAAAWLAAISKARSTAPAFGGGPGATGAPAVMLRCRYCGNLNPPTSTKCGSCGAGI
ncbi:MAG: hypothetical protein ACHQ2Y_01490 [Candidatus Lutacidiplasmatales archaeon]